MYNRWNRPRHSWGHWQQPAWGGMPRCYSTPESLAREMVRLADIRPGMRVLEPEAGDGAIARLIRAACPEAWLDVLEIDPAFQAVLQQQGYHLAGTDALEYQAGPVYGAVVMNPPFRGRQDIWHMLTCFDVVAPGGRLVSIASAESMTGPSTRASAFRVWLREQQAWVQRLPGGPNGIFMQSARPTQVETYLLVIQKPAANAQASAA